MTHKGELYIAGPYDDALISNIEAQFSRILGGEVTFDVQRDERLIGGFLAMVDGKVYDSSILSRVKDVGRHLFESE
ncbi:MAG TPA: F0F1 ATP synthase subunit delta [Feifaniaceae bacterium]|nr:F0F1 ATP synthase subunit delta [Feifaniaceae bacterium]